MIQKNIEEFKTRSPFSEGSTIWVETPSFPNVKIYLSSV